MAYWILGDGDWLRARFGAFEARIVVDVLGHDGP